MTFNIQFVRNTLPGVLAALPITLYLTFVPVLVGAVIGFFLALIRIRRIPVLSQLLSVYLSFFRSIPNLVILFVAYYGLPKLINVLFYGGVRTVTSKSIGSLAPCMLVLILHSSAFICEIVRGALASVDLRQLEAAHAIGMTKASAYLRIIIPQAIIVALPNYFNFVLGAFMGTSVVFLIGVQDIMSVAKIAAEDGYTFVEAYVMVGAIYVIFSTAFSLLFGWIERMAKRRMGIIVS